MKKGNLWTHFDTIKFLKMSMMIYSTSTQIHLRYLLVKTDFLRGEAAAIDTVRIAIGCYCNKSMLLPRLNHQIKTGRTMFGVVTGKTQSVCNLCVKLYIYILTHRCCKKKGYGSAENTITWVNLHTVVGRHTWDSQGDRRPYTDKH